MRRKMVVQEALALLLTIFVVDSQSPLPERSCKPSFVLSKDVGQLNSCNVTGM